ncbi:MAG: type II secretion system F family protein [Anaerolineae bacterium]
MIGALLFSLLLAIAVFLIFVALGRWLSAAEPLDERMEQLGALASFYGVAAEESGQSAAAGPAAGLTQALSALSLSRRLAGLLSRTDLPLTAAEFVLIMIGLGAGGFIIGMLQFGLLPGVGIGLIAAYLPIVYVNNQIARRRARFADQLPDAITLIVGALRTGYGLLQTFEMLVTQMPPPMSAELARVVRMVGLGVPMQRALAEMARRMQNDDLDLVVTAISVQYELGGNLAQTLETITETIRDRVRIKREIRSLTGQQRATAYLLAIMPVATGAILYVLNPSYIGRLFEPGLIRILPIGAVAMELLGFMIMRKIVAIEV